MNTCAFASVAAAAARPEQRGAIGIPDMVKGPPNHRGGAPIVRGIAKNVRHDLRARFRVTSGTWRAFLRRKTLDAPVCNVFQSLAAQLPFELGPPVDDRHQLVFLLPPLQAELVWALQGFGPETPERPRSLARLRPRDHE